MLPSVTTRSHARWQIVTYSLLTVIASLLLYSAGAMGWVYLIAALLLGGGFLAFTISTYHRGTARLARRTFLYSNIYLAALFAAMIVDRLIS
jgi:protoheme IX farnesyltransferase